VNTMLGAALAVMLAVGSAANQGGQPAGDDKAAQAPAAAGPHESASGAWVCPPCGADCDTLHFDGPGACPHCGMALVPASNVPSSDANPRVAILLFDGVEIIDYSGPWEVFGQANFRVFTVSPSAKPVTTVFGQHVTADYQLDNAPEADILVVPGGSVNAARNNDAVIAWIKDRAEHAKVVMSVCTGAFLLAKAGLLDGLSATTFHNAIDDLEREAPKTHVVHDQRYVDNGKIVTTAGLSSGIDGALHVVSKLRSPGRAQSVALGLEYRWDPHSNYARAAFADRYLPNFAGLDGEVISADGDRDHFVLQASVTSPGTPEKVIEATARQIVSGTPHRRSPVTLVRPATHQQRTEIRWRFVDDEGRAWRGFASAEPDRKAADHVLVTLSLTRG
jgi:putative intracellular protease/amidase